MKLPGHICLLQKGFSLVEVLIVVAVISILALTAVATVTKVKPAAEISKLQSDVQVLNTAVKVYKHSGGSLEGIESPAAVVAKLKTIRQKETAQSFVGYTGSMLDPRTSILLVDASFNGPRAVYDKDTHKFSVTTDAVPGFRVELKDRENKGDQEETRDPSALEFAYTSSWVWDYEDVAPPERLDPTLVTRVDIATPDPVDPGGVSDPVGPDEPVLEKLLPPTFSLPSDYYSLNDFPMTLTLGNPNDSSLSKIVYGVISADNWEWLDYTGPIDIGPGDKVLAFVESLKPREFHHSDPADEHYNWTATLKAPQITATEEEIDARSGSTTITITHENHPEYYTYEGQELSLPPGSFKVEYKLIPLAPDGGTETSWAPYTDPFDIGGPQFPKGFTVAARVVSQSPHFIDSPETYEDISTYYELSPPLIQSSVDVLTDISESAVITITNPNPEGSDKIVYQLRDENGAPASGWLNYAGPFPVTAASFPKGFTVAAKALPSESYYRESEEAIRTIEVHFFGIQVTGKTIFILDSSGSMSTNDRIGRLKAAALSVLNVFDKNDSFAFIDYDSNASTLVSWGAATPERKIEAQNALLSMDAGGGTNYHKALDAGLALNTTEADQVIFLSDGYPNPPPSRLEDILEYVDQFMATGIQRFDTVALGSNQVILQEMANRGNGTQVVVND